MRLEVYLTPHGLTPGEFRGQPIILIDLLRAGTTIAAAIAAGARAIYPAASTEEAMRLKRDLGDAVLLAGERRGRPVAGFDLDNSPREMTPERVAGKQLILSTSNGTPALVRTAGGAPVLVGAAVNFSAVESEARRLLSEHDRLVMVCAGREGRIAMEDAYAAGRLVLALRHRRRRVTLDDGALTAVAVAERWGKEWASVLERSQSAEVLRAAAAAEDLGVAASQDLYQVVPRFADGMVQ